MENLEAKEQPPQWMWPFEDELEKWFEKVKRLRDEKYGTSSDDDDDSGDGFTDNELANELRNYKSRAV